MRNNFHLNELPGTHEYDVRILAGDINHINSQDAVTRHLIDDEKVFFIPGNHEFYDSHLPTNNHVIHKVIGDIVFIGSTCWTDYNLYNTREWSMAVAHRGMADFLYIRSKNNLHSTPEDVLNIHQKSINEIKTILEQNKDKKIVLVTHHPLTPIGIAERFWRNELNPAFTSNYNEEIFGEYSNIVLYVHGHIHNSVDRDVYRTRVICNPRGYSYDFCENPDYNPRLIINI
jgi:Icc-related predicted phosphoesterase